MAVMSNQDEVGRVRVRSSEARCLLAPIEHGGMSGLYPQKAAKRRQKARHDLRPGSWRGGSVCQFEPQPFVTVPGISRQNNPLGCNQFGHMPECF